MTIRRKILLVEAIAFLVAFPALLFVFYHAFAYPYSVMDREAALQDYQRASNAVSDRLAGLEVSVVDWAQWDDTYRFIEEGNQDFVDSNLGPSVLSNLGLNVMVFLDADSRIVHVEAFDLEANVPTAAPDDLETATGPGSPLLEFTPEFESRSGILSLEGGPMLVASHPILTSEAEGPSRGTLIFGRFLDDAEIQEIEDAIRLPVALFDLNSPDLPDDVDQAATRLVGEEEESLQEWRGGSLASTGLLNDIFGRPALALRVETPRLAYQAGQLAFRSAIITFLVFGLLVSIVGLIVTERLVVSRIARLTSRTLEIAASGDSAARVKVEGNDELPRLAAAINKMLATIGESQKALRSSEERFRTFFTGAGLAIYVKDLTLRYTLVNPAMAEILGRKPVDIVFRTDEEITGDRAELDRRREIDLRGISGETVEEELQATVEGAERVFHRITAPMRNEAGSIIGVYSVARDVTASVVAQRSLRESEDRYRRLLETLQEGVLVTDEAGRIGYVNPCLVRMLGYPAEDMLGKPLVAFIEGHDTGGLNPEHLSKDPGARERREVRFRHKDGREVIGLVQAGPIHDGEGRFLGAVAVVEDVTDVRETAGELRRLRGLHEVIVKSALEGIALQDLQGRFVFLNPAAERMLGYEQGELIGAMWTKVIPEDQEPMVRDADARRAQGRSDRYEVEVVRKDGVRVPVMVAGSPVLEGGRMTGSLAVFTDIRHFKQAQRELEEAHHRFLTVLDGIDADIYVADMKSYEILFMNRHMREAFGPDLVGRTCWEEFRKGDGPCAHCTNERLLRGGTTSGEVITWEGRNPITGRVYLNYDRAIDWVDGRVARLQVATDITERKKAEEAVAESERKYRALFNQVADPVVVTDGQTRRILDCNDAMLEVYGYTRPELVEMTLLDLMVEEERAAARATLETHRMGRSLASVHRTKTGLTIDVDIITDEIVYQGRPAWISVMRDISGHKREEKRLSRLANFDPLTGLANRNLFQDRIAQALARSERSSDSVALLYMDLDHFKEVNDLHGHAAGDQLLRLVAGRLESSVRKVDTVARLGGDEFVVLLEGIRHPKDAPPVAEKLIDRLRVPFEVEGHELQVTTSIGVALFPQDAEDADGLLRCADIALYNAKRQGRDSVQSYAPDLGEQRTRPSAPVG